MPKLIFKDADRKDEAEWIYGFLFYNKDGWNRYILRKHPKLSAIYDVKKKADRLQSIIDYGVEFRSTKAKEIGIKINQYKKAWQRIENRFYRSTADILETDWPVRRKITARISINPICPFSLDDWSFTLYCDYQKTEHALETMMHECVHFLFAKKWQELHPHAKTKDLYAPALPWLLSELVVPTVLNDTRLQVLLKTKAVYYEEHNQIEIGRLALPAYINRLYRKNRNAKLGFDVFLTEAFRAIRDNKRLFS